MLNMVVEEGFSGIRNPEALRMRLGGMFIYIGSVISGNGKETIDEKLDENIVERQPESVQHDYRRINRIEYSDIAYQAKLALMLR